MRAAGRGTIAGLLVYALLLETLGFLICRTCLRRFANLEDL
jgi:hypothetical protein